MMCRFRVPCPWMPGYWIGCPCAGAGPHGYGLSGEQLRRWNNAAACRPLSTSNEIVSGGNR